MFDNFVNETKTALNPSAHETSTKNSRVYVNQEDLCAQPGLFVQADSESPLMNNISGLMDMINTLQGQIATLVTQVNNLLMQAADSVYETVDEIQNKSEVEDISFRNSTQGSATLQQPATEIENKDGRPEQQTTTMLTSTPRASRTVRTKPNDLPQPKPRTRQRVVPKVPPIPKPRQSKQPDEQKQILLIGDSIISGVNPKGLKETVRRSGISGATIDSISKEIKVFNLDKFSHVIIYVGGNNASRGTDIEYFEEKYDQLLDYIAQKNSLCKVLLVNSCPRGDVDTAEINSAIQRLAQVYSMQLVDMDHAFHNRHGEIIDRYYSPDSIHLSQSGIKRLLGTLNTYIEIVNNFDQCAYYRQERRGNTPHRQQNTAFMNPVNRRRPASQSEQNLRCTKCGESNHSTRQCKHPEQIQCHGCGFYGHKMKRCENSV